MIYRRFAGGLTTLKNEKAMPEPIVPASTPETPVTPKPGEEGGTAPIKTEAPAPEAVDIAKIGDENFSKVFDDPRLWNHPRFKSLNEQAKQAKEYEKAEATRKEEELKKKGEWEQLAKTNEDKALAAEQKFQTAQIDNRIQSEAAKLGVVDLEAVTKLIDRAGIKVDESGTVAGVEEAVKSLLESKPYLKGTGTTPIVGGQTAPGTETQAGLKRFKLSQLQNPEFYRANEKDILASLKANLVEDDTPR